MGNTSQRRDLKTPFQLMNITATFQLLGSVMPHPLEIKYGLGSGEILDVIGRSPRCEQMVKGFVAEFHLEKMLEKAKTTDLIVDYKRIDKDGKPDFKVDLKGGFITVECKMFMSAKASNSNGYKVDFQRTRNSPGDPRSRFYRRSEFDLLAACTYNQDKLWRFVFIRTLDLPLDADAGEDCLKKAVYYRPGQEHWMETLKEALQSTPCHGEVSSETISLDRYFSA